MSKVDIILNQININEDGVSEWYCVEELEEKVGFSLHGNGSAYIQTDRGLGLFYTIEKQYDGASLTHFRLTGFAPNYQKNRAKGSPSRVKKAKREECANCGTHSNLQVDHKDGNKEPIPNPRDADYQSLCKHCNGLKREWCKKCKEGEGRYDAKRLGFPISFTQGNNTFCPKDPRCKGCYWYDPRDFRKKTYKNS